MSEATRGALTRLGFTELEALVYRFLLAESPATGYRVSHGIGKPTANTYKALASLQRRGAAVCDEGTSQLYRAVPPEELLERLEREFARNRAQALAELRSVPRSLGDDRIYRLDSGDQVLGRARAMLKRVRHVVLADAFPGPAGELRDELAAAAARGALVVVKTYAPLEAAGVICVPAGDAARVLERWPGAQLNLVADAREHLLALLAPGLAGVHQAVWSNSTFLSCMQHNHLASEIALTDIESRGGAGRSALHRRIALTTSEAPGLADLLARYGTPPPQARRRATARRGHRAPRRASRGPGGLLDQ